MALTKIPSSLLDTSGGFDLQGNITLGDNERIQFGDGTDLQIYHSGANSFITDTGTGNLNIKTNDGNGIYILDATGNMADFTSGGAVTLRYNNDAKIATSSTGATVTGNLAVTGDLDITGDINSYNVTDLDVTDKTITLGAGQTEANSGGSGIIIDGSSASILWNETNNRFDLSNDLKVAGVIRAQATNAAVQIGDTNGYTFYYTGNSSNRLQLNYDAPLSTGANILMEADSSGRIVFPDQVMLAADYATAVASGFSANTYLYGGSSNDAYNRQKKEERRAEAQRRAREKAEQGIDSLIGSDAERKAAAEARANQPQIQKELRRKAMRERMRKAAERNNIPEAYSKAEKESHTTTPFEIKKERESGKEYPYKVAPLTKQQKDIHYTTPVYPTQLPNKKDKPVWKDKEFQYPGMPIKDLLRGGTTL